MELEGGGGHIWDLHPPIALPVMWGRKWAQFGVNLGNIWVSSPPPPTPGHPPTPPHFQEVHEMLRDFELQHCSVDRHSSTGERR